MISSFAYRLDGVGNRLGWTEANGDVVTLGYDATYQLIHEERGGANSYNGTYTYDGVGNRTHLQDKNTHTTYTYDAGNQLTVEQRPTVALTYSVKGNMTVIENPTTDLTTYTWDGENRLTAIDFGANRHTMTYDADGLRRSFALAGDETRFVWDNQDVLLETNAGGVTQTSYTQTPALFGELVAQRKAGASHFYHFDGLGSTMELTNAAEATTDTLRYRAFGESLVATGSTAPRYRWVGKLGYYWQSDNGIALDYVRARWYRPRIGRWVSQDPLGVLGSGYPTSMLILAGPMVLLTSSSESRLLCYCGGNPANAFDPTGLDVVYCDECPPSPWYKNWWCRFTCMPGSRPTEPEIPGTPGVETELPSGAQELHDWILKLADAVLEHTKIPPFIGSGKNVWCAVKDRNDIADACLKDLQDSMSKAGDLALNVQLGCAL